MFLITTESLPIVPAIPETLIVEGYAVAVVGGLALSLIAIALFEIDTVVDRLTDQLDIEPPSAPVSSWTLSFQFPLGRVPFNADRFTTNGSESIGKLSFAPMLVGRNVPDTIGPLSGSEDAAESSNVKVTLLRSEPPPTSDMMSISWPRGLTSIMSMSSGKV